MNFFREVLASLLKQSDDGSTHSSFKVCDPTAVGDNPVKELSLDVVNLGDESGNSIVSLAWKDSAEKILEKTISSEEASHLSQLIQTDLAQVMKLTSENQYDQAKEIFKNMLKTYTQDTSTPTPTNLPPLHNTQAEQDIDEGLWKQAAEIKLQNIFPSGTVQNLVFQNQEDLASYQGKSKTTGKEVPLWEQEGKGKTPEDKQDLIAPSMSYQDLEEEKEKTEQDMGKRIEREVKEQIESSLAQKQATLFTDKDKQLVDALRGVGRSWEEIRDFLTKSLKYEKEDVAAYLDQFRGNEKGQEIDVVKEKEELNPLAPPPELVSPETHQKLLDDLKKDHKPEVEPIEETKEIEKVDEAPIVEESAKKSICPECNGEGDVPAVRGGHVVAISCPSCSGDKHIQHAPKELESAIENECKDCLGTGHAIGSQTPIVCPACEGTGKESAIEEISRADNADIRKVAADFIPDQQFSGVPANVRNELKTEIEHSFYRQNAPGSTSYRFSLDGDKIHRGEYIGDSEWDSDDFGPYQFMYNFEMKAYKENPNYKQTAFASLKQADESSQEIAYEHAVDRLDKKLMKGIIHQEEYDVEMENLKKQMFPNEIDPNKHLWSSLKQKVASYMNISETDPIEKVAVDTPLTEPIQEEPTMETPEQDRIPFGQDGHRAPKPESWVIVGADLKGELPAFRGKFVSEETESDGTKWGIVDRDGELLKVEMHRITPETEGAQTTEPTATPQIDTNIEQPINTIPSTEKLTSLTSELKVEAASYQCKYCKKWYHEQKGVDQHIREKHLEERNKDKESSQDDLLTIKAEAEQLLELVKVADTASDWLNSPKLTKQLEEFKRLDLRNLVEDIHRSSIDLEDALSTLQTTLHDIPNNPLALQLAAQAKDLLDKLESVLNKQASLKKADSVMDTKCEECGEPLGPEAFLSKWPVCGECTRKRHKKVTQGSDFEKGISQNKTADDLPEGQNRFRTVDPHNRFCDKCGDKLDPSNPSPRCAHCAKAKPFVPPLTEHDVRKQADEPAVEQKILYKDLKKAPAGVDREKAVPASPELDHVLSKLDALQQNLSTLDTAKKQILAKAKEEVAKLEQSAERVQMEKELQEAINKSGVLIDALENKVVAWRDQIYTMQSQEVSYVPNITPKEMLEKIYVKFENTQKFVESVLSGMKSQAVNVLEKTLVKFPRKEIFS